MASYEMQESNLPNEEGKRVLFPRMKLWGQANLDEIAQKVCRNSTFSPGEVKGMVQALAEEVAWAMGEGRSVKIDGLGVFTPALGLRNGFERETGEADDPRRNAASLYVKSVHFRADKGLLERTNGHCTLERSAWKFRKSSARYTPQARLQRAQEYLETHPLLTVADYCQLTGLLRSTAAKELRRWREDETSGISSRGRGAHRVYIKKQQP